MVSEKMSEETKKMLADNHIHFHTMIQDVQK